MLTSILALLTSNLYLLTSTIETLVTSSPPFGPAQSQDGHQHFGSDLEELIHPPTSLLPPIPMAMSMGCSRIPFTNYSYGNSYAIALVSQLLRVCASGCV